MLQGIRAPSLLTGSRSVQGPAGSIPEGGGNQFAHLKRFKLILAGAVAFAIVSASLAAPTWISPASADGEGAVDFGFDTPEFLRWERSLDISNRAVNAEKDQFFKETAAPGVVSLVPQEDGEQDENLAFTVGIGHLNEAESSEPDTSLNDPDRGYLNGIDSLHYFYTEGGCEEDCRYHHAGQDQSLPGTDPVVDSVIPELGDYGFVVGFGNGRN